jgi:N-acetyl-gamma-glutamyl-phosphate reductase
MTRVAIVGATGYVGMEIVRLLHARQDVNITSVVSGSFTGKPFSSVYPSLRGLFDLPCDALDADMLSEKADFIILALPHGVSGNLVPKLLANGKKIIDHSADFRFRDLSAYEATYKVVHPCPQYIPESVYGLPELYRESIRTASLVADPGCYPTCAVLGIAPLLRSRMVSVKGITICAASGISGAGRKSELPYSFCESAESMKAYGVGGHRHTPEIEQELSLLAGQPVLVSFVPHLVPMKRGMIATTHMDLLQDTSLETIHDLYKESYDNEPFVRVLPLGQYPETRFVAGSNFIDIGMSVDHRTNRVIVVSALDNLGKGSSSQAIQAMNLMCGLPETAGLAAPAFYL